MQYTGLKTFLLLKYFNLVLEDAPVSPYYKRFFRLIALSSRLALSWRQPNRS